MDIDMNMHEFFKHCDYRIVKKDRGRMGYYDIVITPLIDDQEHNEYSVLVTTEDGTKEIKMGRATSRKVYKGKDLISIKTAIVGYIFYRAKNDF